MIYGFYVGISVLLKTCQIPI